jgi:hypothetical protein
MLRAVADPAIKLLDDDAVVLRRTGVRFPIELRPVGFQARRAQLQGFNTVKYQGAGLPQ